MRQQSYRLEKYGEGPGAREARGSEVRLVDGS